MSLPETVRSRAAAAVPLGAVALTAVLSVFYLTHRGGPSLMAITCWLLVAVFATGMTWYSYRASRLMPSGTPEKRFWTAFIAAGTIFSVADWVHAAATVADPTSMDALTGTSLARTLGLGCGGLLMIVVMATFPVPHRSARERLCYHLDLATVVTAVGAIGLYWSVTGVFTSGAVAGVLAGPVVTMLVAFAVGRLFLAGAAPFRRHVGVMGPAAAVLEALSRVLGPEMARSGSPGPVFAMTLSCHTLLIVAAWIQHRHYRSGYVPVPAPRKRPYSLLPYLALAGIYTLLFTTLVLRGLDLRAWIIQVGAVICTGIVVARQLTAFIDNAHLLAERDGLAQRLHTMAFTDSLTGLANRAHFLDRLHAYDDQVAVLLIDLDDFKPVNDGHGHAAGDAVLVEAAARLSAAAGPGDLVARLGGDEFAVLLAHQPDPGRYSATADRIVAAFNPSCALPSGARADVRASVGLAVAAPAHVLNLADQAMYRAKSRGKGTVEIAA